MWSAITRIFAKNDSPAELQAEMDAQDSYDSRQAKQRASVKWLLSKAFNNKVPENLKEPFYRDHENQEHLKPQIVGSLANAEIYCLALGNIYSDPNYHNLNHWSILQTLARKGVYVTEPSDAQLTETTLIQTNPLRMSAHMAVIESIMVLYAKEVLTPDRVLAAVQRFNHGPAPSMPENHEQGLLLWVCHACNALKKRIDQELQTDSTNGGEGDRLRSPNLPTIKDLKDLCDGVGLAALVSFYCPEELPWTEFRISYLPTVQDSLQNLGLVKDFCERCLPASVFHMMPEDITYMRGSMKQNLVVFIADLFNILEINPVKCVRYPGAEKFSTEVFPPRNVHGVVHKRNLPQTVMSPIPDLRSGLDDPSIPTAFQVSRSTPTHTPLRKTNSFQQSIVSDMSEDSLRRGSDDSFVVHRGKNIPTLSSVIHDEPLFPARLRVNKEKQNSDTKADERGDTRQTAAGKPSNWDEQRKSSFAGRRSRRNSVTDDSQLTIENFGGSQDNLNFIGRNPDKEVAVHVGRKISAPAMSIENPAIRSTLQDARGSFQIGYDNGCEKMDNGTEKLKLKRQLSSDDISLRSQNKENIISDMVDGEVNNRTSFAEVNKQKDQKGINLVYMQQEKEETPSKSSLFSRLSSTNGEKKTTTFATLPNTTTWQQQSSNNQQQHAENNTNDDAPAPNHIMTSQLNDIRLKLEEKRRHIENEKRKMEVAMNKQRQKVGKAAFLQAVVKGKGSLLKSASADTVPSSSGGSETRSPTEVVEPVAPPKPQRPLTLKDISDDVSVVEKKWEEPFVETRKTPDLENMDLEQYQQSIAQMNSSLHDIQADIQRLASQQNQIQAAQQQTLLAQQQKQLQALQQQQYHALQQQQQQHPQFAAQQSYNPPGYQPPPVYNPIQSSASAPHIPQSLYGSQKVYVEVPQFFLHNRQQTSQENPPQPQRRTWAQQAQAAPVVNESYHQPELRTWSKPHGFMLHDTSERYSPQDSTRYHETASRYQNGSEHSLNHSNSFTLSQQHAQQQQLHSAQNTPSASPQHRNIRKQISQLMDESKHSPVSLQQIDRETPVKRTSVTHAPIPAPPVDDMEPQCISFIGSSDKQLSEGLSRLNITSGTRTYRIPSPTRPLISRNAFQPSPPRESTPEPLHAEISSLDSDPTNQKGFYISFDNDQPKRPKPPLRMKRGSPKKERSYGDMAEEGIFTSRENLERQERRRQLEKELEEERLKKEEEERWKKEMLEREQRLREKRETSQERQKVAAASAIIIGNDLSNPDPDTIDERERKKERIMLLSLQRRQKQEEEKQRKQQETEARREREKAKEEEKARKKEEQAARRAAILEQHRLKKAIEEAEKEGKVLDKQDLMNSLKPTPKLRNKASTTRPRPKTIHIDSGSVEMAEGMLQPARGKKGSSSNLTANSNHHHTTSTMKRDYYRGSQDSLADRGIGSGLLRKDSPDDSRGMSPCHSANQTLGRRSSYKTSRDPSPAQVRGRPKYSTYQNFKGRKSNSMMNLHGSSTDQESFAYRYGDTDSGLGRATPPRRAPSPGMGLMRHLPSPSGPGSLPGLMSKRRVFDDGSSDISSTPSSMMDYTGPRLYKQPTTKSNRSIMLNAVEYCVFPGAVNKEAKRRVLEEIARSDSKHFLILFRDAGCQFRALYSYCPEREEVTKLYGTGPKQVNDNMFDKFFKYNSGGKCFSQIHTKHLTVTIDAFTIHNSLWQGKKVNLPSKKDMTLVI